MKNYIASSLLAVSLFIPLVSSAQVSSGDVDPNPVATSCVSLNSDLKYQSRDSSSNGEVSTFQDFLQSKGYLKSEPTGYFGLLTTKAVKEFQSANGINSTGFVGPITRAKIKSLSCDNSVTTTVPTRLPPIIPGCPTGALYNYMTGEKCATTSTLPPGCYSSTGYSYITGNSCGTLPPATVSSVTVLTPNGGEALTKGSKYTIKWTDNVPIQVCPPGAYCAQLAPMKYDLSLVPAFPTCTTNVCPMYYQMPYILEKNFTGTSYNWSVGKVSDTYPNNMVSSGAYTIQVCQAGTTDCDSSDANFKITDGASYITVLSPNGGEQWVEAPSVTDTISGFEQYKNDITWSGVPDYTDVYSDNPSVKAYLEKKVNDSYVVVGRIPAFAYGSIMWVTGLVGNENCVGFACMNQTDMKVVAPGKYYVRLVDTNTNTWDRSDAPFTILASTSSVPSVKIYGSSGSQKSEASLSLGVGDTFTISGAPKNIDGLKYWTGSGYPTTGYYNRAFFFDPIFTNACGSGDDWSLTCTAGVAGSGGFHVEIYANGQIYKSNYINIVVGSVASSINILSPNGGETWVRDTAKTITWQSNKVGQYDVYLSSYGASCTSNICPPTQNYILARNVYSSSSNFQGSYAWSVGTVSSNAQQIIVPDGAYLIQVCDTATDGCDVSDSYFKITSLTAPSLTVVSPNGGESYKLGDKVNIKWNIENPNKYPLGLYLMAYDEFGGNYIHQTVATNLPWDAKSFDWKIPTNLPAPITPYKYLMRVVANPEDKFHSFEDSSDNYFKIIPDQIADLVITTTSPLPNATFGTNYFLNFSATGGSNSSYVWSLSDGALPTGMTFQQVMPECFAYDPTNPACSSSVAYISGTPLKDGTFNFKLQVVSGAQKVSKSFSLKVNSTGAPGSGAVLGAVVFHFTLPLAEGSFGNEVLELQKFLNSKGYDCGLPDGQFGSRTKLALVNFQLANGLVGDGVVGPAVRVLLNK